MARGFTERERKNIKRNLLEACKRSWTQHGYRKTSLDELCRQAGISKGAFYLFFESKEALFCEVLCSVQEQIYEMAFGRIEAQKNKEGIAQALKLVYREYDKNNFLYDSDSADYTILLNKLSEEQVKEIEESNYKNQQLFLNQPYLKYKVDPAMAMSVLYSLIMNLKNKEILPYNHVEVFDFMVDHLIDNLYESQEEENENRNCKKK
ncbi:MAG: TetR/AcrR family transcriptional regulator [Lachnospiraceae bacterium]|nr:TetR/AcrR family transcriptional regulator [Lachnospiraceae bacterium]